MPKKTPKLTDYPASLQTPDGAKSLTDTNGGWCNTAAMLSSLVIITIVVVFIVVMVWYWNKPKAGDANVKEVRFADHNKTVTECSESEFQKIVSPTTGTDALVVFVADWCGHCKNMKPDLEEVCKMVSIPVYKVTFDDKQPWMRHVMQQLGIEGFPALVLFKQGQKPKMAAGYRPKDEILKFIES